MLGIWHGVEWMRKDLAHPFYSRVERGSPILGLEFSSLMKDYFFLYLYEYCDGLYVVYMATISLVFLSLLCWLVTCFMTVAISGYPHVLTCY